MEGLFFCFFFGGGGLSFFLAFSLVFPREHSSFLTFWTDFGVIFLGFPTKKHFLDGFGVIFLGFPTEKHILVFDFPSGKHVKGRKEGRRKQGNNEGGRKEGRKEERRRARKKEGRKEESKETREEGRKKGRKEGKEARKQGRKIINLRSTLSSVFVGTTSFLSSCTDCGDCLWFSKKNLQYFERRVRHLAFFQGINRLPYILDFASFAWFDPRETLFSLHLGRIWCDFS